MTETHAPQKRGGSKLKKMLHMYFLILPKNWPIKTCLPLVAGRGPNSKPRKDTPNQKRPLGRFWRQVVWLV